ncbi:MAG: hypothetical protein ACQKBY_05240 [Verrucomicrobiales bacterium]
MTFRQETQTGIKEKFDQPALNKLLSSHGIAESWKGLTNSQGQYILTFGSVDAIRDRIAKEKQEGQLGGNAEDQGGEGQKTIDPGLAAAPLAKIADAEYRQGSYENEDCSRRGLRGGIIPLPLTACAFPNLPNGCE